MTGLAIGAVAAGSAYLSTYLGFRTWECRLQTGPSHPTSCDVMQYLITVTDSPSLARLFFPLAAIDRRLTGRRFRLEAPGGGEDWRYRR